MTRLDRAASDVTRLAKRMAAEKIRIEKAKPKMWKDKIILPLEKWRKKQNWHTHEWRNYYPDRYVPNLLIYPGDNETIRGYQDEWWPGFCEYMESVKEPGYGKLKCKGCIFNPDDSPKTTNIRDAIITINQDPDNKLVEFPCKVLNFFKCPFEFDSDKNVIFVKGDVWRIFDDAIKYNAKLTGRKHNTYTVNFEKKWIFGRHSDSDIKLDNFEEFFNNMKFPKFETIGQEGLYDTITTRDKLKSILEEYLDALLNGIEKDAHNMLLVKHFKENPDEFLDMFDKIKSSITLENLQNTDGMTLREIDAKNEEYAKFVAEREKWIGHKKLDPPRPEDLSGACFSCGELANILCKNCNIWTCIQHRIDHAVQSHKYTIHENSSSSTVQQ